MSTDGDRVRTWPPLRDVTAARVVVGYDGSERAATAVRWAAREAQRAGLPLAVVHVVDFTGLVLGLSTDDETEWSDVAFERARALADEGADLARHAAPDVPVRAVVGSGSAAEVLVEASRAAELVVVGTRGRGDLAALCLGSVSTVVMTHAECPAVVVHGQGAQVPGPEHPVVVGVDGSAVGRRALEAAAEVAARDGAPLRVVTAWRRWPDDSWLSALAVESPSAAVEMADAAFEVARVAASAAVHEAVERHPGLEASELVVEGTPAAVLAEQSRDAGLLVVGSRGRGAARSLLLGSVTHGVVHAAACPVEVVRSVARTGEDRRTPEPATSVRHHDTR